MRRDDERLQDILISIAAIERGTAEGRAEFNEDEYRQIFVAHNIQTIGEAVANLSIGLRSKYRKIPWSDIVAMRNIIVHGYFHVDRDEVWRVVEHDLPPLKEAVTKILETLKPTN